MKLIQWCRNNSDFFRMSGRVSIFCGIISAISSYFVGPFIASVLFIVSTFILVALIVVMLRN